MLREKRTPSLRRKGFSMRSAVAWWNAALRERPQLMRAVRTLQEAAAVVSAIEANALVRAAHRAALGNGLSDVAISGLSEPAERMLEAVREKRFEGAFTVEMFLSELQAALASADDADLSFRRRNRRCTSWSCSR